MLTTTAKLYIMIKYIFIPGIQVRLAIKKLYNVIHPINRLKKPKANIQQTIQQCCQERKWGWRWADLGGHVMATSCKPRKTVA